MQFGYAGSPYVLNDYGLEGQVPVETQQEAERVPGIDMANLAVMNVQDIFFNRLEIQQAALATNAANYASTNKTTLSGTAQWSDFTTGVSDPVKDVEAGKEAIRSQTGKRPTVMVIAAAVFAILKQHPKIIDRLKYTSQAIPTTAILASLFDIPEVVVGDSLAATDAGVFSDTWGKDVVLAYTPIASLASKGLPSYGYTYQLDGYPLVREPYYDENTRSWLYPQDDSCAPVIAGAESGYVIKSAVA